MRPARVQPAPCQATGKLQDTATVAPPRRASTLSLADRLAGGWCANMTALVAELRALRRERRSHECR